MPLDIFQNIIGLSENDLHPKFKLLRDELTLDGERNILMDWVDGFEDRDNKIIKEFQTTFHSAFWEFYLHSLFKEAGLSIDFSKNRPDFIINKPYKINIEAVVAEIKQNGRKETERNLDDILSMAEPPELMDRYDEFLNESITRHSNAIISKKNKYLKSYSKCNWISENDPFVIAMCSFSQVNYGKEFHHPLLALLYGYYFDPNNSSYSKVRDIVKPGTSSNIPVGIFNDDDMNIVSAIIYSCTLTMGKLASLAKSQRKSTLDLSQVIVVRHDQDPPHYKVQDVSSENPEELSDGVFVFHNPNAKNKIPESTFEKTNAIQVSIDSDGLKFVGNNLPIVSRLNIPKLIMPDTVKNLLIMDIINKFN